MAATATPLAKLAVDETVDGVSPTASGVSTLTTSDQVKSRSGFLGGDQPGAGHSGLQLAPDRLLAAGFTRQPADALLVAEIADLTLDVPPPPGIELRGGRSARARDGRR